MERFRRNAMRNAPSAKTQAAVCPDDVPLEQAQPFVPGFDGVEPLLLDELELDVTKPHAA